MTTDKKQLKNTTQQADTSPMAKYYKFALYLVVIILINLVAATMFFRIDLTSNDLYSLSEASVDAVATLEDPLTINVFFSKNLPAPYNQVETYLHDLLAEYEANANGNLSIRFYNVSASEGDLSPEAEENRKIAQSFGIHPVNVQKIEQDENKIQRAYMGMALIHGDVNEKLPAIISTEGLEYQITSAIQKMNNKISALANLPEKIQVNLVVSSSIAQVASVIKLKGLDGLKSGVQEVVNRLSSKNYGNLQFVSIDPSMGEGSPEQMKPYERFGLQWPALNAPNGQPIPAGKGTLAIGLSYAGKSIEKNLLASKIVMTNRGPEEQYVIASVQEIETFINENVDNLIDINEDLGYLSTHGTTPLSQDLPPQLRMMRQQLPQPLSKLNTILSKEYTIKKVPLGEEDIPESIDTLVIAGPKQNFTDWELYQIDQFLMKGKSLAIYLDAFNEIQQQNQQRMGGFQQPVYLPLNTGLEKLLNHYGVSVKKSYLMDEQCYKQRDRSGNEMDIFFAPIIQNENINHDMKVLENVKGLIGFKLSPLEAIDETIKKNNLDLMTLFSSSEKAWEMKGKINLLPFMINPPKDDKEQKSMPLAYLLQGEFPSYFADKSIPERPRKKDEDKEAKEAEGEANALNKDKDKKKEEKPVIRETRVKEERQLLAKGKKGRILLLGSSHILNDNVLDEEGRSPNAIFLLNTLDYLNNREDIAIMRSKTQRFNPLDKKGLTPLWKNFTKWFNSAGIPILCILLGIFIWFRRSNRKRKIRAMFMK